MMRMQESYIKREDMGPEPSGEIEFEQSKGHGMGNGGIMAEPSAGWMKQIIERLDYLESRAEATRRAEEAARAATKEAKEAARRAEELISQLSQQTNGLKPSPGGTENKGKLSDDIADEIEGLKRAQKRLQDELLSKSSQLSSMSMAQEDAFRSLNMLSETCRLVRAESERASMELQTIQTELRKSGANASQGASPQGGSSQLADAGLVEGLRRDLATLQQQVVTVNSSATQQAQQVQKNVSSIVDFAEKVSARQEVLAKEIAEIKQHLSSKGNLVPVEAPPKKPDPPPTAPERTSGSGAAVDVLRKDVEELAMAMGEVAGRFSSMEQDITQAFASCARAVDVKEIENHFISRQTALEDKVTSLGKQIASIKDNLPISSPPTSLNSQRQSDGYNDGDQGSSNQPMMMGPPPQVAARAWGTPPGQPGMMSMNGMPMVPVNMMPMYPTMQPGMIPFGARAPSTAHLAAMMKQGMMQQAQASAGRFTRMSTDGEFQSGPSSSMQSRMQPPSNRVMKVKPEEGTGMGRERRISRADPNSPRNPQEARASPSSSPGPSSSGPLTAPPPAAPFLSRLQQDNRASSDGNIGGGSSSRETSRPGQPQFLDESMLSHVQQMQMGDRDRFSPPYQQGR